MSRIRALWLPALVVLALAVVVGIVFTSSSAQAAGKAMRDENGNAGNPRVLPPQSMPYGSSYAEWSVKWWQWAYSLPVTGHPLFDETGADCAAGQSGPVWFLGGVFNVSGSAVRDLCTVPAGKALFFPILNVEWDNFCPPGSLTDEELRATAKWYMDLATDLSCELDGKPFYNLAAYRVAGDPFAVQLPGDNLWQYFGCDTGPGSYYPLVPDGIYLMLAPLPVGGHTLHFKGTVGHEPGRCSGAGPAVDLGTRQGHIPVIRAARNERKRSRPLPQAREWPWDSLAARHGRAAPESRPRAHRTTTILPSSVTPPPRKRQK
jgi:hypothetical protein